MGSRHRQRERSGGIEEEPQGDSGVAPGYDFYLLIGLDALWRTSIDGVGGLRRAVLADMWKDFIVDDQLYFWAECHGRQIRRRPKYLFRN